MNPKETPKKMHSPYANFLSWNPACLAMIAMLKYLLSVDCFHWMSTKTICYFKPHTHSLHLNTKDVNERSGHCTEGRKGLSTDGKGKFMVLTEFSHPSSWRLVSNKPNWDNKSWQQITFNANFNVTDRWKLWVSFVKFKLQVKFALVNSARPDYLESLCWRTESEFCSGSFKLLTLEMRSNENYFNI